MYNSRNAVINKLLKVVLIPQTAAFPGSFETLLPCVPPSESDSNSDSDISGKKVKELKQLPSGSSKKEMTPRRLTKGLELLNSSTNHTTTTTSSCSPLNLQVIKSPSIATSSSALTYQSSPGSSSYSLASSLGNVFRCFSHIRRV